MLYPVHNPMYNRNNTYQRSLLYVFSKNKKSDTALCIYPGTVLDEFCGDHGIFRILSSRKRIFQYRDRHHHCNCRYPVSSSSAGACQLCRPSGKPFPEKIPAVTAGVAADSRNFPSFLQINIADRSCLWLRCDPASASDPVYQFSWNGKYQSGT